ncbi:hypothetical protein SKAU_G00298210 [Synaphobranchus kaupii]|uniref:DTHCT domain-containing protein n=1 Tax=Synaphobranchus kaupii TaxID=118154 RepID=A0A9Q1IN06_SYNKA|nr:hypothetical protein SKAU_G00298210 [Synaphobranchus kaupii]
MGDSQKIGWVFSQRLGGLPACPLPPPPPAKGKQDPKPKGGVKRKPVQESDDSDSSSDNLMSRIKGKKAAGKKIKKLDSEDDSFQLNEGGASIRYATGSQSRPGRAQEGPSRTRWTPTRTTTAAF